MTRQEKVKAAEKKIKESKSNIENLERKNDYSIQKENQDIAENELERKYKDRQEQIDVLTKSLTSSSRIGNWISRITTIYK